MSYLIVVAHPDDEVLGAGGLIFKLSQKGIEVNVCVLSGQADARANKPKGNKLEADTDSANSFLGVNMLIKGEFPNICFNTVPHLDMVQFIEKAIEVTKATTVVTHHPNDLNNDHYHTSISCQAAIRLFQRRSDILPVLELMFMEVPSATDWALNSGNNHFKPNLYIEITKELVEKKLEALSMYEGVMRDYPHPRSCETIEALAAYRGSQAGIMYAEAYESVFRIMK